MPLPTNLSAAQADELTLRLQHQTLTVAKKLGDLIEGSMSGSRGAEVPTELIKLWGPLIEVADQLNAISIATAITRLTALGYRVSEGEGEG